MGQPTFQPCLLIEKSRGYSNKRLFVLTFACFVIAVITLICFDLIASSHQIQPAISRDVEPKNCWNTTEPINPQTKMPKPKGNFSCPSVHFNDVLLIVVFNFPFYANIVPLKKFYKDVFQHIYFCGSQVHEEVHDLYIGHGGLLGYKCMQQAIKEYPGKSGYLYVNDDMIVNWWQLMNYDLNRLWRGYGNRQFYQDAFQEPIDDWYWWRTQYGISQCRLVYKDLIRIVGNETDVRRDSIANALHNYIRNGNGRPRCGKSYSDFFYVPSKHAKQVVALLEICGNRQLFLEIAIPNVLRMLDDLNEIEIVNGIYIREKGVDPSDPIAFWTMYDTNLSFIHPFKMNARASKKINKALFKIITEFSGEKIKSLCHS